MTDTMISLKDLFGLYDRIEGELGNADLSWPVTKAVLQWLADQGYFARQELSMRSSGISPAIYPPPPTMADMVHEVVARFGAQTGIPAGPQASSGKPDPKAAGDLNAVADHPECEVKAPMGAEGGASRPVEAPATPVAGGVALSARWTPEEDEQAIAMRLAGHSSSMIAAALGRPEQGTAFRLRTVLKDRIEAARAKGAATPAPELAAEETELPARASERGAESGGDCSGVSSGESPCEAAEEEADQQPATAANTAPPFDPSRPVWWRTANANLNALGYRKPFNAAADLQLVEDLLKGIKIDVLSADMLISAIDIKNRWRALLSAVGTPEGKLPNLEEQGHLIEILRARAAETSLKAAE